MKAGTARARRESEEARPDRAGAERGIPGRGAGRGGGGGWRTGPGRALPPPAPAPPRYPPTVREPMQPMAPGLQAGPSPTRGGRRGEHREPRRRPSRSAAPRPSPLGSAPPSPLHPSPRQPPSPPPPPPPPGSPAPARLAAAGRGRPGDWLRRRLPALPPTPPLHSPPRSLGGASPPLPSLALLQPRAGDCSPGPRWARGGVEAGGGGGRLMETRRMPAWGLTSRAESPGPTLRIWGIAFEGRAWGCLERKWNENKAWIYWALAAKFRKHLFSSRGGLGDKRERGWTRLELPVRCFMRLNRSRSLCKRIAC